MEPEVVRRPHRPIFGTLPASPAERWRLVEEFVDIWYGAMQPGDGYSNAELDSAEEELGLRFPRALRDWYQLAGRRGDVWCRTLGMYFVEPSAVIVGFQEHLVFLMDDFEGSIFWGIRLQDLDQEDPPVWGMPAPDLLKERDPPSFQCNATTTDFAITHMLSELTMNNQQITTAACQGDWLEYLNSNFERCDLSGYYLSKGHGWQFWEGVDIIVMAGGEGVRVAARTEQAYARLNPSLRSHLVRG